MKPSTHVNLEQSVLPYYDFVKNEYGLMFALPPSSSFPGDTRRTMTILRVSSRGKTSLFTDICLFARNNPNLIYQWAWTPFFLGDRVHLVCPVPPVMDQGCVPLSHVPERYTDPKRRCIFTPAGFHRYIEEPLICDLKEDIVLPLDNDVYELEFAGVRFGAFEVLQGHVLWIEPSIEALSCKLWTCHLARLVYLHPILHPALVE